MGTFIVSFLFAEMFFFTMGEETLIRATLPAILLFNEKERHVADDLVHRMVKRAVEMEGTVTGEHGVGIIKRDYLNHELGEPTVDLMRKVCSSLSSFLSFFFKTLGNEISISNLSTNRNGADRFLRRVAQASF